MNVTGKTVVVTGAGSGMGRELTLLLLKKGAQVAAVDLNESALQSTAVLAGYPKELALFTANIAEREQVRGLPERVQAHFGQVDALINNAGIVQPMVKVADLPEDVMDRVLAVNLRGTIDMTRAFLPHLLSRPEAQIVNISSMGGFLPVPGQTVYGAAKAGVKLFTEGLHAELRGTPVQVTLVFPGGIDTNIMKNSGVDISKMMEAGGKQMKPPPMLKASEAARQIIQGMEQGAYHVLVGNDAKFMNVLMRLHPERAAAFIAKQMAFLLK